MNITNVFKATKQVGRRYKQLPILLLVAACMVSVLSSSAQAYNLWGFRWFTTPTSGCCLNRSVKSFTMSSFLTTDAWYAWTNGIAWWSHNNNASINVNMSYASSSTVKVWEVQNPNVTWDGLSSPTFMGGGQFATMDMFLNTTWAGGYSWQKRLSVTSHEVGHMLGLDHRSGACTLMQPDSFTRWDSCGVNSATADDINGVNSLY